MAVDALDHMEEAWNLEDQSVSRGGHPRPKTLPYSPTVFGEEAQEFRRKLVRGSVRGNVNIGLPLVARRSRGHRFRQDDLDA